MTRRLAAALAAGLAAASVAGLLGAGCGGDDGAGPAPSTTRAPGGPSATVAEGRLADVDLAPEQVAEVDTPTALAARLGSDDLYVTEQAGRVRRIEVTEAEDGTRSERLVARPVVDLTPIVRSGGEQGLLGLAFSSDGRQLYLFYNRDPDGHTELAQLPIGDATTVRADDGRTLMSFEKEHPNHNGGQLALGPDGYLYLGLGDGGGADDPDDRAQDTGQHLGKILRIDPQGDAAGRPYAVPADNPFVDGGGQPEIWAYGLRNPWRFSFDTANGDLWIADVGQGEREELDHLPATDGVGAGQGANLGWDRMEGTRPHEGGSNPKGGVLPVFEYDHGDGACAVVGGYVYRGRAIPGLAGAYLFTDLCHPGLRAITLGADGEVADQRTFDLAPEQVQSFGEDADGELYVLQASGQVLRIVPEAGSTP
jgi:glucose/arabinose dehydrogenase